MLPERRSTVSSNLNPSGQNDHSFILRRGKKFGRIVKLKLSHLIFFFVSLFFFSCIFSGHKLLFHGKLSTQSKVTKKNKNSNLEINQANTLNLDSV